MSDPAEAASFTISVPRAFIREYFDGLARVESVKRNSTFDWSALCSVLTPFALNYLSKAQSNSSDASDDDSDKESDHLVCHLNEPLKVDITKDTVGDKVKTIAKLVSSRGTNDKDALDQLISALTFIRDNTEAVSDEEQVKEQAESCCPDGGCVTGVCEVTKDTKDEKEKESTCTSSSSVPVVGKMKGKDKASAQSEESSSKKPVRKVVKKPSYQESEGLQGGDLGNIATTLLSSMGIKSDADQSEVFKNILGNFGNAFSGGFAAGNTWQAKVPEPKKETSSSDKVSDKDAKKVSEEAPKAEPKDDVKNEKEEKKD